MKTDQAASLRRQFHQEGRHQARTIVFVSGKGGVGKSNTALNFSMNLLKQNRRVLLMDMDIGMGNIEILLGKQCRYSVVDFFEQGIPLTEMMEKGPLNLRFIAGGSGLSRVFQMDAGSTSNFLEKFGRLSASFDYIIFDMGAGATNDSMQFIMAADDCFVVATPEPTAIMDAYSMIKYVITNRSDMPMYIIMNQVKSTRTGKHACQQFNQVIDKFLGIKPEQFGLLPFDPLVHKSVMQQRPYTLINERAPVSKAMQKLTDAYISGQANPKIGHGTSFVSKLKKWIEKR